MLISEVLEKTKKSTAAENMANRLADRVRNIWLDNRSAGRDFLLGVTREESQKRELNRKAFREAFVIWQKLYLEQVEK